MTDPRIARKPREVTGRMVMICLLAFFGVVFAVNIAMLRAATSTFGGVETESVYRSGILFKREIAAARAQEKLRWQVNGTVTRDGEGRTIVEILVRDPGGFAPSGIDLDALLAHPTDSRHDHHLVLAQSRAGVYRAVEDTGAGQWNLVINIYRGEERVFLSRSRVILR